MGEVEIENTNNGGEHDLENAIVISIAYDDFASVGTRVLKCPKCGVEDITDEAPALFTCLGYSAPEDGSVAVVIKFTVNSEAILEYENITGKTVKYGLFATMSNIGTDDIVDENGVPTNDSTLVAEVPKDYVILELKITGFTDEYKDTRFAMGAYVEVTDGEAREYSYLQYGTPDENEKYCFVSYNDVIKILSPTK